MINLPEKCLRDRNDCEPLARIESDYEPKSFICCGLNNPPEKLVEEDIFRVCFKSIYIDERSDWSIRDIKDMISVLAQGLSIKANMDGET